MKKARLLMLLALALAGCGGATDADAPRYDAVAAQLPLQEGAARLLLYRDYDLAQSLAWVPVKLNGADIGGVGPGHVMVCDVPPGTYKLEAQSQGLWPGQDKTVSVAAGQQIYAKIGSFKTIDPDTHGQQLMSTYVVMLQDTASGRRDVGQLWYTPCQRKPAG
jgi:hypothetical protein